MNACIFAIQSLPFAVISGFWLGMGEMFLLYLIIFTSFIAVAFTSKRLLYTSFVLVLLFFSAQLYRMIGAWNQEKIYVYKSNKSTLVEFYSGYKVYCLKDSSITQNKLDFLVKNNRTAQRAFFLQELLRSDSHNLPELMINNHGVGKFRNRTFAIPSKSILENTENRTNPYKVDFLIISSNPKLKDLEKLENLFDYRFLVFDASNSQYKINNWLRQCKEQSIPYIDCSTSAKELCSFLQN
jgi:hypothetical protein